jgi:hypothetical protein
MFKVKSNAISKLYLVAVIFCLFSCGESKPDDMRKVYLQEDQNKVTENPELKSDSISYLVKGCVNKSLSGIKTDKLKYYSKEKNDTILIIVKVGDMRKIEKSSRKQLLFAVEDCLKYSNYFNRKKIYIDVEGNFNTLLIKTPVQSDLDGKYADEKLLLPFYGKSVIKNKEGVKK